MLRFEKKESWFSISQKDKNSLDNKISKLPFQIDSEDADAKRFDLLVYKMQLALLNKDFGSFNSSKSKVIAIANRLLKKRIFQ